MLRRAAPWLALGGYVIGSAALAAYSRVNWGPKQAMESRYATVSLNLYLVLIALAVLAARDAQQRGIASAAFERIRTVVITSILVLSVARFPAGLWEMSILQRERLSGLAALQFSAVIDTTESLRRDLRMIQGFVPAPLASIAVLERLHLLQHPRRHNPVLKDASNRDTRARPVLGTAEELKRRDMSTFEANGWAVLPKRGLPAPRVVLAYGQDGRWITFADVDVGEYRDDVVAKLHRAEYQPSGWRETFKRDRLPPEANRISAWAVDPVANKAYRLEGDLALPQ